MADINVDIKETEIFNLYPEVLTTLLKVQRKHLKGQKPIKRTDIILETGNKIFMLRLCLIMSQKYMVFVTKLRNSRRYSSQEVFTSNSPYLAEL